MYIYIMHKQSHNLFNGWLNKVVSSIYVRRITHA